MANTVELDKEHDLLIMDDGSIKIDRVIEGLDEVQVIALSRLGAEQLLISLMDWKRVEDALPDDEIEVLAYMQASDCFIMASREGDGHWISTDNGMRLHGITHWCDPIPPVGRVS